MSLIARSECPAGHHIMRRAGRVCGEACRFHDNFCTLYRCKVCGAPWCGHCARYECKHAETVEVTR